jgi:hypothetical protein
MSSFTRAGVGEKRNGIEGTAFAENAFNLFADFGFLGDFVAE